MHLLITDIAWDTEGQPFEECGLPNTVLALDAPPGNENQLTSEYIERLSDKLSDAFGFCHFGFAWHRLAKEDYTHAGGGIFIERLGVMPCLPVD